MSSFNSINFLIVFIILIISIRSQFDYTEPKSQWKSPCSDGKRQSPIDFPANYTNYDNTPFVKISSVNYGANMSGLINGTLEIHHNSRYSLSPNGTDLGYVIFEKKGVKYRYDLKDIYFHMTSEHRFNGLSGDIEMHLVHVKNNEWISSKNITDLDTENSYLVIGILMKVASSKDHENLAKLNIRNKKGPVTDFNITEFPPLRKPFLFYEGSLTTPNCDESVNWIIVHTLEKISKNQYDYFRSWLDTTYSGLNNNRKTQPIKSKLYYQFYPEQSITPIKE